MNPKAKENVKKCRKDDFVDDGRVIADMSIDGMPGTGGSLLCRSAP